ncbi:MAG: hypothetical protein ACPGVU_25915, partial [Limisphaerales bacterium]
ARVTMVLPYSGGYYPATIPLDSKGYVLVPLQRNHVKDARVLNYAALPELKGVDEMELRTSGLLQSPNVLAALRLVDDFRHSPLVGTVQMKAINIAPSGILTVTTDAGSRIKFSSEHEFLPQILRWQQIHHKGRDAGQEIVEVDLSITNHVPAKFRTASAPTRTPSAAVRRTGARSTNPRNA